MTITRAPARRANWSAKVATPPVPCTSTVWPGRVSPSSTSARHAVAAALVAAAASASVRYSGTGTTPSASRRTCSASTPSRWPPRCVSQRSQVRSPEIQPCANAPDDAVADRDAAPTPGPTRGHLARAVGAEHDRQPLVGVVLVVGDLEVARVERRRAHADDHLAGAGLGHGALDERQVLEAERLQLPGARHAVRASAGGGGDGAGQLALERGRGRERDVVPVGAGEDLHADRQPALGAGRHDGARHAGDRVRERVAELEVVRQLAVVARAPPVQRRRARRHGAEHDVVARDEAAQRAAERGPAADEGEELLGASWPAAPGSRAATRPAARGARRPARGRRAPARRRRRPSSRRRSPRHRRAEAASPPPRSRRAPRARRRPRARPRACPAVGGATPSST